MGNWKQEKNGKRRKREREPGDCARFLRLQELIREEVNFLLRSELRDPRLDGVEITMVEVQGECARLWFTTDTDEGVMDAFECAAGFLRSRLADSLGLKRTPELRFRRDPAARISPMTEEI